MSLQSRLIAYFLLPLLFFWCGYLLLYGLGEGLVPPLLLQTVAIGIALLLGSLPLIVFSFLIRSQLKPGFALLRNGDIVTLGEITLGMILGNRITAWRLYLQHLDTEVCLQGDGELVYVKMGLDFEIPPSKRGKQFIKHYSHNVTVFEAWVQRAIYLASLQDKELLQILPDNVLLNEEDERVLRSKFLSALEAQPLDSIKLPLDTASLTVNRKLRIRPTSAPALNHDSQELSDEELNLDQKLINELGLEGLEGLEASS